jgi:hypothetical protein
VNTGEHDADITAVETPNAILRRLVGHLRGVAVSLDKAIPLLETLGGSEREYLAFALADEADELVDAAKDLAPALRTIGRDTAPLKGLP